MIVLGIESTCDETAASLVEDGRHLLSNVISTSVKEQALYGGVVPEIASRRHCEFISATVKKALLDAGKTIDDVDAVAVTFAPGLIGAVLVGVNFAKGLAYSANKPLVPVHHLRGHIAALYLTHPELKPPFLCLVASGGHSHIVEVLDYTHYHILGHTVDDAAGEAFDKVARTLGLPYPGGPSVANAAKTGGSFTKTNSMAEAFKDADIVYPKSWAPFAAMEKRTNLYAEGDADGIKALEKELLAQNADHKDWCCTEELMKTTKDGKALYLHCLPADISGLSCPEGEVDNSVFDRYLVPLYKQASFKPYIIAAMIFLAQVKDPVKALMELDAADNKRKMF